MDDCQELCVSISVLFPTQYFMAKQNIGNFRVAASVPAYLRLQTNAAGPSVHAFRAKVIASLLYPAAQFLFYVQGHLFEAFRAICWHIFMPLLRVITL